MSGRLSKIGSEHKLNLHVLLPIKISCAFKKSMAFIYHYQGLKGQKRIITLLTFEERLSSRLLQKNINAVVCLHFINPNASLPFINWLY